MGAKRARRNRKKNAHHSDLGVQKRATKYVQKELKRMKLSGGGQRQYEGFRVHPEFGWCHKALQQMGLEVVMDERVPWRKQRCLRVISEQEILQRRWIHVRNKGLRIVEELV